uniref:Uncharacterized protein n=1 Tax=viral metagenome TaxID=1070528 RepID=A0A6M3LZK9_9ZZZZ
MSEQTIKCTRSDCDTDIPLVKENLIVVRPEVPLLSAQCPECGKTRVLNKGVSKELSVLYFESELFNELEASEDGPLMPSMDLSQMVTETLKLLGYRGNRWDQKIKAIGEFVKDSSTYQNPQGLHTLLAAWKVDSQHIPMIVQKVFGSIESQPSQYNFNPNIGSMGPIPNYTGMPSKPVPMGAGYTMQQTPQGQVIIIPPAPPATPAPQPQRESDDTVTIVETVEDGKVVSRTIKQKASAQSGVPAAEQKSSADELKSVMDVLKDFGVIGSTTNPGPSPQAASPEITKTLEKISSVLATIGNERSSAHLDSTDRESAATTQYKNELKALNDEIKKMREDQHKVEMSSLKDEVSAMRRLVENAPANGLSDFQFGVDSKQKNLKMISDVVASTGNKIVEPLIELQMMQGRFNGLLAVRQLELEDKVAPGTYLSALATKQDVPDEVVSNTLKTWRERAGSVRESDGDVE